MNIVSKVHFQKGAKIVLLTGVSDLFLQTVQFCNQIPCPEMQTFGFPCGNFRIRFCKFWCYLIFQLWQFQFEFVQLQIETVGFEVVFFNCAISA